MELKEPKDDFQERFFAALEQKDAPPEIINLAVELCEKILKGEEAPV